MRASDVEPVLHGLFLRGLEGDAQAYQEFLRRIAAYLRAFIGRRLVYWSDDVEDLVQECLLATHLQRHTFQIGQPVTSWIGAIARYKLIDLLRAKSAREMRNVSFDELEIFAESQEAPHEARRDVALLLDTLPDRHRLPLVMVKLEGLSIAEAARHSGMSESAVKIGVHRGLKALVAKVKGAGRENR